MQLSLTSILKESRLFLCNRSLPGSRELFFTIHQGATNGPLLGFIRKFRPARGYSFPWQAFAPPPMSGTEPNRPLGSFYGKNGKAEAVKAVQKNGGKI